MNRVILIGRLTCDPAIRQTPNGKNVASYRLAVDRPMSKGETDFFQIVAFGNGADFACKFLHKGMRIAIEGRIQTRSYNNKEGKQVTVTEIVADRHEFCESKAAGGNGYTAPAPAKEQAPFPPEGDDFTEIETDDDLPF